MLNPFKLSAPVAVRFNQFVPWQRKKISYVNPEGQFRIDRLQQLWTPFQTDGATHGLWVARPTKGGRFHKGTCRIWDEKFDIYLSQEIDRRKNEITARRLLNEIGGMLRLQQPYDFDERFIEDLAAAVNSAKRRNEGMPT